MTILFLLVPLLVMVVFAVVIGIIVWAFTRPPRAVQPLSPPPGSGTVDARQATVWPSGRWNAKVTQAGALTNLGARQGELTLQEGWVSLRMADNPEPEWRLPCSSIRVTRLSFFTMTGAALRFEGSFGTLNLEVSLEKINTFMNNDAKNLRERGYARELADMLAASGAQVV